MSNDWRWLSKDKIIERDLLMKKRCHRIHLLVTRGAYDEMASHLETYPQDVHVVDKNGDTPLTYAAMKRHANTIPIVKLLLAVEPKQQVTHANKMGCTALMYAARHGDVPLMQTLLSHAPQLEAVDEDNQTPATESLRAKPSAVHFTTGTKCFDHNACDKMLLRAVKA